MAYRKKNYKRRAPKRRVYKRKGVRKPTIKRMIKREIDKATEDKYVDVLNQGRNLVAPNNTSFFNDFNVIKLTPANGDGTLAALKVLQGPGAGQRIGNTIRIKKLTFKGTLIPLGYQSLTNPVVKPMQVKMFLFYRRSAPTIKPAITSYADFFQFNGESQIIEPELVSMWAEPNNQHYRVLATRIFKVGRASSNQYADGTTGPVNMANNDFKLNANFNLDITKMVPKLVRYHAEAVGPASGDTASRGLYAMFVPVPADGSTWDAAAVPLQMSYALKMVYEDA